MKIYILLVDVTIKMIYVCTQDDLLKFTKQPNKYRHSTNAYTNLFINHHHTEIL